MPPFVHDLLAHAYHLALRILYAPLWRAPLATLLAAIILRLTLRRRPALLAPLGVLAGWMVLNLPGLTVWPHDPMQRLPGAAVILAVYLVAVPARLPRLTLPLLAAVLAWWLRGTPLGGAPLANTVPWALGLWAGLALARRLAGADRGPATLAAAVALSGALYLAGAAAHWVHAAGVVAWVGLALLGIPEAVPALAAALVVAGTAAISASDRGRFLPVDLAALAPFWVWALAPRILPRLNRAGPGLAAALAAMVALAAIAGGTALLNLR
jgi:hypothetical protein